MIASWSFPVKLLTCECHRISLMRSQLWLTHWGRVTDICVSKITIIGSDNGLSPGRHQAIIWTNAGIWSMGPLGTNFSEILIEIHTFSFRKMHLKMSSGKRRPFCLGLNVLRQWLGAIRQQVITWAHVDPGLCRHMVSLGHNESMFYIYHILYYIYINTEQDDI